MSTTATSPFTGPFTVRFRNAISTRDREEHSTPDLARARELARDHGPWNNTEACIVDAAGTTVPRLPLDSELPWRPTSVGSGRWVEVNSHKLIYLPLVDLDILEQLGDDELPVAGASAASRTSTVPCTPPASDRRGRSPSLRPRGQCFRIAPARAPPPDRLL